MDIQIDRDFTEKLAKAKAAAQRAGIALTGDTRQGQFAGQGIAGHYAARETVLTVTITDKPCFLPESLIGSKIREFFA